MRTPKLAGYVACVGLCIGMATTANAAIIISQAESVGDRASQYFPNFNAGYRTFDDFMITETWSLTSLTAIGFESGNSALNSNVIGEVWSGVPGSGGTLVMSSVSGSQSGDNLSMDFGGQLLGPGTYWLQAYVVRSGAGGQWFWELGANSFGSTARQAFISGAANWASATGTYDPQPNGMAFTLSGDAVNVTSAPEPASMLLLGTGLLGAGVRRWRQRKA